MELTTLWFGLIAVLWIGYLAARGLRLRRRDAAAVPRPERARAPGDAPTIGPVWDGNEVWLIVAGGATFAAFPEWYATLFSGFYLALFADPGGAHRPGRRDRVPQQAPEPRLAHALGLGHRGRLVRARPPVGRRLREHRAGRADRRRPWSTPATSSRCSTPMAWSAALALVGLILTHGAIFLALKTDGDIRARANRWARLLGLATAVVAVVFLAWTIALRGNPAAATAAAVAALALVGALVANRLGREGWAFLGDGRDRSASPWSRSSSALYPNVMPSSTDPAYSLTIDNASSTDYTLAIMTVVAIVFVPLVLAYQGWTYWVFRKRVSAPSVSVEP